MAEPILSQQTEPSKSTPPSKTGRKIRIILFIVLFAVAGVVALIIIRAAAPTYSFEAESASTVNSPATLGLHADASGFAFVQFNKSASPLPYRHGQTNGPSGNWALKFNDEFNGTTLNTANWSTGWLGSGITAPVQSQELACYDPAQVIVEGGMLKLKAIRKDINCNKGTNPHPYASGSVNSKGKKEYSYGFFEARIWLDAGTKIYNWPAWWLDGYNWPTDGELDIMEGLSGNAKATWHGPLKCANGTGSAGCGYGFGNGGVLGGWHVFAAEWKPGIVTSYYDGVKLGSYSSSTNITSAKQFLILGEQIGPENQYGGPIKVPSEMDIDYVRVWQ